MRWIVYIHVRHISNCKICLLIDRIKMKEGTSISVFKTLAISQHYFHFTCMTTYKPTAITKDRKDWQFGSS